MKKKLTPWFPPGEQPFLSGWYERDWDGRQNEAGHDCDWWDGEFWRLEPNGRPWIGGGKDLPWRGLAQKP